MSSVGKEAAALYHTYAELSAKGQQDFLTLVQGTSTNKPVPKHNTPSTLPALLYAKIASKLYSYQGIKLPPYAALAKTSAEQELRAALEWLCYGEQGTDRKVVAGLIELTADAMARQVIRCGDKKRVDAQSCATLLAGIPIIVDNAYPGYRHNRILHLVAEAVAKGKLPIQKTEDD